MAESEQNPRLSPARRGAVWRAKQLARACAYSAAVLEDPRQPDRVAEKHMWINAAWSAANGGHTVEFLATMAVVDFIVVAAGQIGRGKPPARVAALALANLHEYWPEYALRIAPEDFEAAARDWVAAELEGAAKWKTVCQALDRAGIRIGSGQRRPTNPETLRREWMRWRNGHGSRLQFVRDRARRQTTHPAKRAGSTTRRP